MIAASQPMMPRPLPTLTHAGSYGCYSGSRCFAWLLLAACIGLVSGENYGRTQAAAATPTAHPHIPTLEVTAVSRLRTPAAVGNEATPATRPHSIHGRSLPAAKAFSACSTTSQVDDETLSDFRSLTGEQMGLWLRDAASDGAVEKVRALLAAGADVAARGEGNWTALHRAARKGRVEVARCLLLAGAEVDARDSEEFTPLHKAAMRGHAAVVRLLLVASANPDARDEDDWTPLHFAAAEGYTEVATALLVAGADAEATDDGGRTPLDFAIGNKHHQLIHVLERYENFNKNL